MANLDESVATVSLDLIGPDGTSKGPTALRSISIYGTLSETLGDLFPDVSGAVSDYVRLRSNRRVTAFEVLESRKTDFRTLTGQDVFSGSTALYGAPFAAGGSWQTALSLVNLDFLPGTATMRLIGDDGRQIGVTVTQPLPPRGKILLTDKAFVTSGHEQVRGYLELTTDGPRVAGSLTISTAQTANTAATALPLMPATSQPLLFSCAVMDFRLFAGLSIVNAANAVNTVTIESFDSSGTRTAIVKASLPARGRHTLMIDGFMRRNKGGSSGMGYVLVSADGPVAGLGVTGTKMLTSLGAIPPAALSLWP